MEMNIILRLPFKAARNAEFHDLEKSPFVELKGSNGESRFVKTSSLLWYLQDETFKQSNDRSRRFMQIGQLTSGKDAVIKSVGIHKIRPGDWCVFKPEESDKRTFPGIKFMLGRIWNFGILNGTKSERSQSVWSWHHENDDSDNVGAVCMWYKFEIVRKRLTGNLSEIPITVHGFHPCSLYICSIPPPKYEPNSSSSDILLPKESLVPLIDILKSAKLL